MPASPMWAREWVSNSEREKSPNRRPPRYDRQMKHFLLILAASLPLILGGCGIFVRGHASEHGPNDVKVGVPF
jgi:hypothetical protein